MTARRVSGYSLCAAICAYINEQNGDLNSKFALLYFNVQLWEKLQLTENDFITVYRPWNDILYSAMDNAQNRMGDIRIMAPITNVIKCYNARKKVPHFDEYPKKYDPNSFKNIVFRRGCMFDTFRGDEQTNDDSANYSMMMRQIEQEEDDDEEAKGDEIIDDLFWLQNIDQLIQSEGKRDGSDRDFCSIAHIPDYEVSNKHFNVRALIQRIYVPSDIEQNSNTNVRILVQDASAHCCMIDIKLSALPLNGFGHQRIDNLMRFESRWFDFYNLQLNVERIESDFDESAASLLMQFEYIYLQNVGSSQTNAQNMPNDDATRRMSKFCFHGLRLSEGHLLKDGKMYYHLQHFAEQKNGVAPAHSFKTNDAYLRRLQLRHFECESIKESKLKPIHVRYRDGDKEWLDLKNEKFSFYEISSDEDSESSSNDDDDDDDAEYKIGDKHNDSEDEEDIDLLDEEDNPSKRKKNRKKLKKRRKKEGHHKKNKKRKRESIKEDEQTPNIDPTKVVKNEETVHNDKAFISPDPLIDMHATIIISNHRYDAIVEESKQSDGSIVYKVKFDDYSSDVGQSEWVKPNQIETQRIVTCDNFKISQVVQVRENGQWMDPEDAAANIAQIYEGATGAKIYQVHFPEFDVYMYKNERDIRKC